MLKPLLDLLLILFAASPAALWAAVSGVVLLLGSWLVILGLCCVSGEADDRADCILAQLQRRQTP
jgi:hypothetical protein